MSDAQKETKNSDVGKLRTVTVRYLLLFVTLSENCNIILFKEAWVNTTFSGKWQIFSKGILITCNDWIFLFLGCLNLFS